jgi:oligopeptide/dipeptide ABC transporter ATP-binding protein
VLGLIGVALLILVALSAPLLFSRGADVFDFAVANQNSSSAHLLGTDRLGRDILLRLLVATRLSLLLALAAVALALLIGVPLGASMALLPTRSRSFGLRTIDTMIAFPALIVALYVGTMLGPGPIGAVLGIGIAISFGFARIVSTLALSVGGQDYILAARVLGVRGPRLLLRYILPNISDVLIVGVSVAIGNAIVAVAGLSFLGLGIQPPAYDWGRMLTEGVNSFYVTPAAAVGPAVFIAGAALAFGFCGEALAKAMNPLVWTVRPVSRADSELQAEPITLAPINPALHANGSGSPDATRVEPALEVRDLKVVFPGASGRIEIIKGVSFSIQPGEVLGIVGESGSGKTMTSLAVAQLVPYPGTVEGTIKLHGTDLAKLPNDRRESLLGTSVAVVFQDPMSSLNPALRIGTQMTEGVERHRGFKHQRALDLAFERLTEVNIPAARMQLERHPHQLSGGMRQRVMIAMGLMNDIQLLIADEPTTALDVTIQAQIMDVLARVNDVHKTAVALISHNLALVRQNCDQVVVMYAGRIVEELPANRLTLDPQHPYTRALVAAVPSLSRSQREPLQYIPGQAPDIARPPSGCPYHPRCPLAMDICKAQLPPLVTGSAGRRVACWAVNGEAR